MSIQNMIQTHIIFYQENNNMGQWRWKQNYCWGKGGGRLIRNLEKQKKKINK